MQRIIEVDVYRMMAMLAFPEARRIASELDRVEQRLSDLVARLDVAPAAEEPDCVTGIAVVPIVIAVWWAMRSVRVRLTREIPID